MHPFVHQSIVFWLYTAFQCWSSMLLNSLLFHTSTTIYIYIYVYIYISYRIINHLAYYSYCDRYQDYDTHTHTHTYMYIYIYIYIYIIYASANKTTAMELQSFHLMITLESGMCSGPMYCYHPDYTSSILKYHQIYIYTYIYTYTNIYIYISNIFLLWVSWDLFLFFMNNLTHFYIYRAISTLNGKHLKLVDHLSSLSSSITSTESDVNTCIRKAWTVIDRLLTVWKSNL